MNASPSPPRTTWSRSTSRISPTNIGSVPILVQRNSDCGQNNHNCLDVHFPDQCCDNQSYCYVNARNEPRCCPIGSNCVNDSPCNSKAYWCAVTTTLFFSAGSSSSSISSGGAPNDTTTVQQGCCGRRCPQTSYFLCPPDLGGKCCPYGATCRQDGHCLLNNNVVPTPTTPTPLSQGHNDWTGGPVASTGASALVAAGSGQQSGMSTGTRTGMGVGIALGALLVIALVVAVSCFVRRRWSSRHAKGDHIGGRAELVGSKVSPGPMQHDVGGLVVRGTDWHFGPETAPMVVPVELGSEDAKRPEQDVSSLYPRGKRVFYDSVDDVASELGGSGVTTPEPRFWSSEKQE